MTQAQEMPTKKVTTINTKGQVTIPQTLQEKLDITPKTKLTIYTKDNKIIIEKIDTPTTTATTTVDDLEKQWDKIVTNIAKKGLKISETEIQKEIDAYRAENKR
ncbi:MAG: AbrB/MazE/SpoVT family DNA-binding domain-containing protein [Candidatus Bathyarchaeota archaeon]|nr:AbrB/MazE/SpoVT family DNA-binding domain-containing protein [Candidatus Termiticorpusculum sp.]